MNKQQLLKRKDDLLKLVNYGFRSSLTAEAIDSKQVYDELYEISLQLKNIDVEGDC